MTGFVAPDGETEDVDETTEYWTESGDALVRFSPTWFDKKFSWTELPGTGRTVLMVMDMACSALKKGWCKYYLRFPNDKDRKGLLDEVMDGVSDEDRTD